MTELTAFDYEDFLAGDNTQAVLDSVVAAARRYCGWHVSPVRTETVLLNGDGKPRVFVATKKMVSLDSVSIDGEPVTDAVADPQTPGSVVRRNGVWPVGIGNVEVTFTHGYTEAADWRLGLLRMTRIRLQSGTRESADLKRKKIDDVEYEWFEAVVSVNAELAAAFSQFRLLPGP